MKHVCKRHAVNNFLLLMLLFVSFGAYSQGSLDTTRWRFSNPKPFGFTVMDLDYFDDNNAIAVGYNGGISFTSNGGSHWSYGPFTFINPAGLKVRPNFSEVHFVTSSVAYAVGSAGCVAKTEDGGVTWNFISNPFFASGRNINAVWFLNKDTGYIGGQFLSVDSIPKLYFTRNGGTTWDSLNAPIGGKTVVGYVDNPNLTPLTWDVTAKGKEIFRIEFLNDSVGYVIGSASGLYPRFPAVSTVDCLPNGTTTATSAHDAALVWKFKNGQLSDYSLSKERLGYRGFDPASITCSTRFGQITPQVQSYKALGIISDSLILVMSFNNSIVVRIGTGVADSSYNVNLGTKEQGKYEVLNFPFPPYGAPPIPNPNVLLASNPYRMVKSAAGKFHAPANFGLMWTSVDSGANWISQYSLPQGLNYSSAGTWAMDITPSGRHVTMGTYGVVADSVPGGNWQGPYIATPLAGGYFEMEFADCNNGITVGGASINVTTDCGKTWTDRTRADFANLYININAVAYPAVDRAWFTTNVGTLYFSNDQAATMNPVYSDPNFQFTDIAAKGNDSLWMSAYSSFSVAPASRTSAIIKSTDGGANWQTITGFPVGTTAPRLDKISFANSRVGYVAGSKNAVYKTADGGNTWTDISPFPSLNYAPAGFPNASVTYTEVQALDSNTVFVCGNMFTSVGEKRVYRSIDGGASWKDITGNIPAINPVGNLNGILMHDTANGYVIAPGGVLMYTNNGGSTWNLDLAPAGTLFETMAFAPKTVPSGVSMNNRKLFVTGPSVPNPAAIIMEYGNLVDLNVNASENISNASCSNNTGGSITVNATGGFPPYSYSLNGGPFQSSNVLTGLGQGVNTLTIKDNGCQSITKDVTVGFDDDLTLALNNDTAICSGTPLQLNASGNGSVYSWTPTAGLSGSGVSNPVATVNTTTTYTVSVQLNGCTKSDSVTITANPNPTVNAGPGATISLGSSTVLNGSSSGIAQTINWSPSSSLTGSNTLTPSAAPQATTVYTLTVSDANGCTATDTVTVQVIPVCVKVMNAFSPNNDGINDRWNVTAAGGCASRVVAAVYNRYGSQVFRSENYTNDWDGTYKGKPVPDGTYYYTITYYLYGGKTASVKGDVTIIR